MTESGEVERLQQKFHMCQKMLTAFGDEVRQKLLLLMVMGDRSGMRAADIAEQTSLTRSAVSHHMQILKDADVVKCRKDGKCVYYYFDSREINLDALLDLFGDIKRIIKEDDG